MHIDFHFLIVKLLPGFRRSHVLQCFSPVEAEFFDDVMSTCAIPILCQTTLPMVSSCRLSHLPADFAFRKSQLDPSSRIVVVECEILMCFCCSTLRDRRKGSLQRAFGFLGSSLVSLLPRNDVTGYRLDGVQIVPTIYFRLSCTISSKCQRMM